MAGGTPLPRAVMRRLATGTAIEVNIIRSNPLGNDAATGFQRPFNFTLNENFRVARFRALLLANTMKFAFEWIASDFTLNAALMAARYQGKLGS